MTTMNTAPGDPPVERVQMSEHFSSEQDATHLYQPKGMEYATSMAKTRFALPQTVWGPVRNLAILALTESANRDERERALQQLITMADAGDLMAAEILDLILAASKDNK